jgi:hypothetical protein
MLTTQAASMVKYNISQSTIHFVEVGLTVSTFHRKCSICRDTVKKYMPHAVYDVEGDDDPNVVAWDDVPVESDIKPANGTGVAHAREPVIASQRLHNVQYICSCVRVLHGWQP